MVMTKFYTNLQNDDENEQAKLLQSKWAAQSNNHNLHSDDESQQVEGWSRYDLIETKWAPRFTFIMMTRKNKLKDDHDMI